MLKKIDDQDHDGLTGWDKSDMKVGHPGKGNTKKAITDSTGGTSGKLFAISIQQNVIQQAASSVLTQANSSTQIALSLLQGG